MSLSPVRLSVSNCFLWRRFVAHANEPCVELNFDEFRPLVFTREAVPVEILTGATNPGHAQDWNERRRANEGSKTSGVGAGEE